MPGTGNETIDELARVGSTSPISGSKPFCRISTQTVKFVLQRKKPTRGSLARFFLDEAIQAGTQRFHLSIQAQGLNGVYPYNLD